MQISEHVRKSLENDKTVFSVGGKCYRA